ncbi:restriction endonuclease [Microvirga tunisiensis]|uniref:Mrr-like domain-containing protein n=1 Tax=Microvirga tunisiensis TaxID=2108360 RepID=A0A5N7MXC5_9HYPH|nr:restriction endonuclease [Microvirga tunisiensis]MPR13709.1 hypothetical protein [Microvirga tunisiensis]MPR31548.1 hypothetical protein [Microvirga tunisiensis]
MNQALNELLSSFRDAAKTEREKGAYFERLATAFLQNDPLQTTQYEGVWTYSDWAQQQGIDRRDTGIDLVAKLKDAEGYCAIQCKFYEADKKIAKSEIDSFFTASGKAPFKRRLIIDTTDAEWSEHAENALKNQHIETLRSNRGKTVGDHAKEQRSLTRSARRGTAGASAIPSLSPR